MVKSLAVLNRKKVDPFMAKKQDLSFEDALRQLETVVGDLEGGDLGLDESLDRYERGVALLGRCRGLLDVAERKVALLTGVNEQGEPITESFDASATLNRESKPASKVKPKAPETRREPEPEPETMESPTTTIEPPFDPT